LKKSADHFQRIGLVGNAEKSACAASVRTAARLIQRSGREVLCDDVTGRLARLKCPTLPQTAALAREVDARCLVFDGVAPYPAILLARSELPDVAFVSTLSSRAGPVRGKGRGRRYAGREAQARERHVVGAGCRGADLWRRFMGRDLCCSVP